MNRRILRPICRLIGTAALAGTLVSCGSTDSDSDKSLFDRHLDRAYRIEDAHLERRAKMSKRADEQAEKRWDRLMH